MMVATVIDTVTHVTYTLERTPLGEGATAKVWRGTNQGKSDQPSVAVKIAHRGTSAAALLEYWAELALLERLGVTKSGKSVPWAHRGRSPEDPGASIIVMELIPDDWQLARLALETGWLQEGLALETAIQYVQLLIELHALGYCTRGDRKSTDIRYDRNSKRLVVLDWNRAVPFPSDAGKVTPSEWVRQDIRGFGRIWVERVLGRAATESLDIDDTDLPEWCRLTRGFRRILARSIGARSAWGYQSAEAILADLKQHNERLEWLRQEPAKQAQELVKEINRLAECGRSESDPGKAAMCADDVLTLLDLAIRMKLPEKELVDARSWAEAAGRGALQMAAEATDRVYHQLRLEDYRTAVDVATEALQKLLDSGPGTQTGALSILRWQIVAELGFRGNELALDMSSAVAGLATWLRSASALFTSPASSTNAQAVVANGDVLRQQWIARLEASQVELDRLIERLPESVTSLIEPLRLEIVIRSALGTVTDPKADRALVAYRTLHELQRTYALWLRADLAELDRLVGAAEASSLVDGLRSARKDAFHSALISVRELLAGHRKQPWMDLVDVLAPAREAFLALTRLADGPDPDDQAGFQFVSDLAEIDRAFATKDFVAGLRLVPDLFHSASRSDRELIHDRTREAVVAEVEHILATPPFWPDERERAVKLLEVAGVSAGDLAADIDDWGQKLRRYWRTLGLSAEEVQSVALYDTATDVSAELAADEQQVTVRGPGRILDLKASQVDGVLANALALDIEVVDRRWVPANELPQYTVAALLGRRQMARLAAGSASLQAQVNRLSGELDDLGHRLIEAGEIGPKLRELDAVLADSQTTLAQLQQKLAGRHVETVRRAQELVDQTSKAKETLGTIQSESDDLRQLTVAREKGLAEILEHSESLESSIAKINDQLDRAGRLPDRVADQISKLDTVQQTLQAMIEKAGGNRLLRLQLETRVVEGMIAIRRLNGRRAQTLAEHARKRAGLDPADLDMQDAVELLEQSAAWLQGLPRDVREALRKWRTTLDEGSVREAYNACSDFFCLAGHDSDIETFWLVGEMHQELQRLRDIQRA